MSANNENNNKAVLSIVGALIDHLADTGLISRAKLAEHIEHAASAHEEAGEPMLAETVRFLMRALTDDDMLTRMTIPEGSLSQ